MKIKTARLKDISDIVKIVEHRRMEYQLYQPTFWRKSTDSEKSTCEFFSKLVEDSKTLFLAASEGEKTLGFLIAREIPTPPVYSPGGRTYLIDDFCVLTPDTWLTVGEKLIAEASTQLESMEAAQIVIVCGDRDIAKAELLRRRGLTIASNWWTQPL